MALTIINYLERSYRSVYDYLAPPSPQELAMREMFSAKVANDADAFSGATQRWTQAVTANVDDTTDFQELFDSAVLRLSRHMDNDDAIRDQIDQDAKQALSSDILRRLTITTGATQTNIAHQISSSPEMRLAPLNQKQTLVAEITELRSLDLAKAEAHDRLTAFETTLATRENGKGRAATC